MDFLTILMIAVGLSMDSLSVNVANGIFLKEFSWRESIKVALIFGVVQAGFTAMGWALGVRFSDHIMAFDHWVAFALLAYLGGKMIYESFKEEKESQTTLQLRAILVMSVATSIDAAAVGVGMAFLQSPIVLPLLVIFLATFLFSLFGMHFGFRFGKIKFIDIEIVGGVILIGIGVKILIEHTLLAS